MDMLSLVIIFNYCCGGMFFLAVGLGVIIYFATRKGKVEMNANLKMETNVKPMEVNLNSLEKGQFAGWDLLVEGEATVLINDEGLVATGPIVRISPVAASYDNPKFGRVEMGKVPGKGWTQYSYREHRGGVVDVPYAIKNGQLLIGYFHEPRFLTRKDGVVVALAGMPGGFADPGEDALTAAKRELFEELGLEADIFPLVDFDQNPLPGIITNRSFTADDDGKNDNQYFGLSIDPKMLTAAPDGTYRLDVNYIPAEPTADDKSDTAMAKKKAINAAKSVAKLTFVPWTHLGLMGRDGIVQCGTLRVASMFFLGLLPETVSVGIVNKEIAGKFSA